MMDEDEIEGGSKQKKKEDLYVLKEEMFVGKSIYESYNYYHHLVCKTAKEEYFRLCRTIEFGKELLPIESKVSSDDKKPIKELYDQACGVLKNEILKKPRQTYQYGDPASKSFPIYTMSSDDGGAISCLQEQYVDAVAFFIETQYSHHIPDLRNVDNQIFHYLSKYDVISKMKPLKELIEDKLKQKYSSSGGQGNAPMA